MDILIADAGFNMLGGAERAALEIAIALGRRGHRVAAFSTPVGDIRSAVAGLAIPVLWSLDDLPFRPDIIHAQHHLDAMTAIVGLPGVPVLYHCHGATFFDAIPRHPRIGLYVAVSNTLAERVAIEAAVPAERVKVVLNSVDLGRFPQIRVAPAVPRRAAVYGNQIAAGPLVETIVTALGRRGMTVDLIGRSFGAEIADPEPVLSRYDLVFASGKSAIDALACGCAVVIVGLQGGCGELVSPGNLDRLRAVNFTIPANSPPADIDRIDAELERFDPDAVGEVALRLRSEASVDAIVGTFERLYLEAIDRVTGAPPDPAGEARAVGLYLGALARLAAMLDGAPADGCFRRADALGHAAHAVAIRSTA